MKLLEQSSQESVSSEAAENPMQANATTFVLVDAGNPVAGDVADCLSELVGSHVQCIGTDSDSFADACANATVAVIFARSKSEPQNCPTMVNVLNQLAAGSVRRVCIVTNCCTHFDRFASVHSQKETAVAPNAGLSDAAQMLLATAGFLRTGFILSSRSTTSTWCRRLSWLAPLLSETPRSSFVSIDELADCIHCLATTKKAAAPRAITLLGANRAWSDVLSEAAAGSRLATFSKPLMTLLKYLGGGLLVQMIGQIAIKFRPRLRQFYFDTITPQSEQELLSLCHRHNMPYIEVCGYNNGVNHFGWKHAGKTVIPTAHSGTTIEIENDHLLVDAGVTLRQCVAALAAENKQFYVAPNYSYIAMGTVFFVPVHGSGSHVSTLGDTIQWVRFINPQTGEFLEATREELLFRETMYNRSSGLVLLQMVLKVRSTPQYSKQTIQLTAPDADTVWDAFYDTETSNIEARKSRAVSNELVIAKYYAEDAVSNVSADSTDRLSVPQDTLGSLWDRLEENRITAWVFHLLVRKLAYHVELFLRKDEFAVFWEHHQSLPVSKIQLRLAKRDGMPHSPFGDADCLSADLFMSRRRRDLFQQFIKTHLPDVRVNPGKQSL